VRAKLYSMSLSHPSQAARLMLERKGIEYDVAEMLAGMHPLQLRAAGFRGGTVPAMKLDGRRIQGSLRISRALEEVRPDPPLFPADKRAAVAEAEAWGERELQPVPRRLFRWALSHDTDLRRWMAGDVVGMPAPGLVAVAYLPLSHAFARMAGASTDRARADVAELRGKLDHVDELIATGTIGGDDLNAADYQIATTVRVLLAYTDLRAVVEDRPAGALAMRVLPDFPGPIPRTLPAQWLRAL
jgi:glutathione S-transferase